MHLCLLPVVVLLVLDASRSVAVHNHFPFAEFDAGTSVNGPLSSTHLLAISTHVYPKLQSIKVKCNTAVNCTKDLYYLQGQPLPYHRW